MKQLGLHLSLSLVVGLLACSLVQRKPIVTPSKVISYTLDPQAQRLQFYWKDEQQENFRNFKNLKAALEKKSQRLIFAMNGGMYNKNLSPQGLYIEKGQILSPIDTLSKGYGNFYMQPNGIFYLTKDQQPHICTTTDFEWKNTIAYATQSGPMLVIDGALHPIFQEGSANLHIRNGVGLLPNGQLLFAMSKEKINFHDFASFFKNNGCQNALYLDGFVSRTFLPASHWEQLDGNFGVLIAEVE